MAGKKKFTKKSHTNSKEKKLGEVLLGIDYGERNIGLALGHNGLTMPLHVVNGADGLSALNDINILVKENKVNRLIMGLPLNAEGKETIMAKKIRIFAKLLKVELKLPVDFVSEYASSIESMKSALNQDVSQKRRQLIDHLSAAIILKNYYESLN
ncbi:MAG: Holliday junction resolvase RuvX [Patescibacteria group bacterium]